MATEWNRNVPGWPAVYAVFGERLEPAGLRFGPSGYHRVGAKIRRPKHPDVFADFRSERKPGAGRQLPWRQFADGQLLFQPDGIQLPWSVQRRRIDKPARGRPLQLWRYGAKRDSGTGNQQLGYLPHEENESWGKPIG